MELISFLQEIEDITDINGTFFINIEDNKVIESTIQFQIPIEILWEIGVLRDTFQHFANGIEHGQLRDIMIEGDKGYILIYNVSDYVILMAMAANDINLAYVKLAMINILDKIRTHFKTMGEQLLKIGAKELGVVGGRTGLVVQSAFATTPVEKPIAAKVEPEPIAAKVEPEPIAAKVEPEPIAAKIEPEPIAAKIEPEPIAAKIEPEPIATKPEVIPTPEVEEIDLILMIKSIESKNATEQNQILGKIFENLKIKMKKLTGVKMSKILLELKETILNNIGSSLALFDISRSEGDLSKIHDVLTPDLVSKYEEKIENWVSRIVK